MAMNAFFKKISILTVIIFTISSLSTLTSFAESNNEKQPVLEGVLVEETVEGINSNDVQLSKNVLSEEFDLEEEVRNMPSIDEMTKDERKLFDEIVEEQTELSNVNEKEIFKKELTNFFDKESDTYNDLSAAQEELVEEMNDSALVDNDYFAFAKDIFVSSFGVKEIQAAKKKKSSGIKVGVTVRFAGAVFNAVIGFAVGGGVGAIQSFIIKKGKAEAKRIFTKTVTSRLKAWGAKKLAISIGVAVAIALNYLDIGTQIAKQLDKRDKRPNNGWVDIY
ncbi:MULTISPECIES: hypothetical protein [Bacillus]|uniref:hypothetical protein n=1 Tax=Bacillus TaxID=1386 RepID=UPI000D015E34|nr:MULTISPECIES: hypothetical protein [Bacillus]MDR0125538.1 hypothetical protein [Bacillus zhangzhouensis]PRO41753.1 hypothetical protein C6W18_07000 [Bacillus sp. LLTC93]